MKIEDQKAYRLIEKREIKELQTEAYLLKHVKTGAKVVLMQNDDDNKVFYIGFRTPPTDSTGVPHIIEHSVLCGSTNFPVKDPFIELAKGSLNTFLNAMTFPDKTLYPVASCNDTDFKNLMHVYLDAVFYPNIYHEKKIFLQEGWHYELNDREDELKINGVVYSEMKGAFSSPDDVLDREVMNSLFPDTSYSVESGGDPDVIPTLTYEDFIDFHSRYYHPSNSYIYLYGNMDMVEYLTYIDENYLSSYEEQPIDSTILRQQPFDKIRRIEKEYSISESEQETEGTFLTYNAVIDTSLNKELYLAFQVLDYAICSAPGAPLKKALIDDGIGNDVYSLYENGVFQPFFSIVARETELDREEEFISEVERVLKDIVKNGIDKKSLQAALNYYEFKYREADFGSYPKGLMYGLQIMDSWLYDDNLPFLHIEANDTFALLKEKISTDYFEKLIQKYLLDNKHKSIVIVKPKSGLSVKKDKELCARLNDYKNKLSDEEIDAIIRTAEELKAYQEEPDRIEDLMRIPLLKRSDLKKEAMPLRTKEEKVGQTLLLSHDEYTNGIGYIKFVFSMNDIPKELFAYTGILKAAFGYMDTQNYSYGELFNEINIKTGGMGVSLSIFSDFNDYSNIDVLFEIKMKTLYQNTAEVFRLIEEMIASTKYEDTQRLYEILSEMKSRIQAQMISSGHTVAAIRALSYFSEGAALSEISSGIPFYRLLEELTADYENRKEELVSKLKMLERCIFRPENLIVDYTASKSEGPKLQDMIVDMTKVLYTDVVEKKKLYVPTSIKNEGFKMSSQIQYVCRAGNFRKNRLEYTGTLRVLKTILGYDYMWNNVRVKGGAYGCMTSFTRNGDCYFVSYRDPNLKKTIKTYEEVVDYLKNFEADERTMTQYVIGTISDIDTPLTPAGRGNRSYVAYMTKTNIETIQKERTQILNTTAQDIRDTAVYAEAFLADDCLCVVGNEEEIEKEKECFEHILPLFH